MNLAELKEAYKARKLALDSAKKEEEKYKALLKDAMLGGAYGSNRKSRKL